MIGVRLAVGECQGCSPRSTEQDDCIEIQVLSQFFNILDQMLGKEKDLNNEDFLYEEEVNAAKRFVGRWGSNA